MKAAWLGTALIAVAAAAAPAGATTIASTYTPQGGGNWLASFSVTNDGLPASIGDFTIYFAPPLFSNLVLQGSPGSWDSIVVQPDAVLAAPGFLDSLAPSGGAIGSGATLGGFQVRFAFAGFGAPGSLKFDINDANFNVLFSGQTTVAVVPEPAAWALASAGLTLVGGCVGWRRRRGAAPSTQAVQQEHAA